METDTLHRYQTDGGLTVYRRDSVETGEDLAGLLIDRLDHYPGVLMSSSFEFPGRYTRWDLGFAAPPVAISCRGRGFSITALDARGEVLLKPIAATLESLDTVESLNVKTGRLSGTVRQPVEIVPEEQRSRQPSIFSILRAVTSLFASDQDPHLGLYGAFGYDLAHQFEAIDLRLERAADQRDLVLFLPDEILVVDHMAGRASRHRYDFITPEGDTRDLERSCPPDPYGGGRPRGEPDCDHQPGEFPAAVERAKDAFRRGDLFEVVLSQEYSEPCPDTPGTVFRRLRDLNPAPYCALMNLGEGEFLVAASPEMYVRVEGRRVETCPISGTIARGNDALGDAAQIAKLLNSAKDEAELTMCTDVDRNDKSRICEPGSVRVIGRRQVELYSRLIHTVDHVEGILRPEFDALDAFLSHTWAVTVTGAPKRWAIDFIEQHERSARRWYGGAIGRMSFDGGMNTGLTLRTVRMKDGIAEVRAGATLLYDSDPAAEDAECRLKASALFDALRARPNTATTSRATQPRPGDGRQVLLVDHEDSFVHTLANYLRQTGATVDTLRPDAARQAVTDRPPSLVVLSPGPGRPEDFAVAETIASILGQSVPLFGVCLGLQGIAEYFGARLAQLDEPVHGKPSEVTVLGGTVLEGLPRKFRVGRYHSLYAERASVPASLEITAETGDGVIMALEHRSLPVAAVQFHPESILSLDDEIGMRLIENLMVWLSRWDRSTPQARSSSRRPYTAVGPRER